MANEDLGFKVFNQKSKQYINNAMIVIKIFYYFKGMHIYIYMHRSIYCIGKGCIGTLADT